MYFFNIICVLFLLDISVSNEINSRNVRQAVVTTEAAITETTPEPNRECYNFQLQMGITFRNYHSCCGETKLHQGTTTTKPTSADCVTNFAEKSTVFECSPSKLTYLKQNKTDFFDCAGCLGQNWAKDKCSSRWYWLGRRGPVNCWVIAECFKGACNAQEEQLKLGNEVQVDISFCGDGICEAIKNETKQTCPLDCCAAENPQKCAISNNTCPDICCSEEHCCDLTASSLHDLGKFWTIFLSSLVGVILFINLLCCCFCCCLYDKCNTSRKKRKSKKAAKAEMQRNSLSMKDRPIEYVNSAGPV